MYIFRIYLYENISIMLRKIILFCAFIYLLFLSNFLYANKIIKIQSGLNKIENDVYKCSKKFCKINLIASWVTDKNYKCVWNFDWWNFKTKNTDKKCNPWYVDYKNWFFIVSLKVYKKGNFNNIFIKDNIKVLNQVLEEDNIYSQEVNLIQDKKDSKLDISLNKKDNNIKNSNINLKIQDYKNINFDIEVQSWLNHIKWNIYKCSKKYCKINLIASWVTDKNYKCIWNFDWWTFKTKLTNKKCNPWYINYKSWKFNIKLEVFDKVNNNKIWEKYILIQNFDNIVNKEKINNSEKQNIIKQKTSNNLKNKLEKKENISADIIVQGRLNSHKKRYWNKIICEWVDSCNINFKALWNKYIKNLEYKWNFWNKNKYIWKNPKSIKYLKWNYIVRLSVYKKWVFKAWDLFYVEVKWKIKKEFGRILQKQIKNKPDKNLSWKDIINHIKISWILANNKWKDTREFIEIINNFSKKIDLKWLILADNSKKYKINKNVFIKPFKKKRFYKKITKLSLWNKRDSVNLYYKDKLIDRIFWNFNVPDNFLITHDNVNLSLERVFVKRVIDWDTIQVKFKNNRKIKVRFLWIDTPETKDPRKSVQFFWKQSSEFTKNNLLWKYIYLEYSKQNLSGRFWRLLAYVFLDKDQKYNFNSILIEKWYARVYLKYPFKYEKEFLKLQIKAKKQKLWIWQDKKLKKQINKQLKIEKNILNNKKDLIIKNIGKLDKIQKKEIKNIFWKDDKFVPLNIIKSIKTNLFRKNKQVKKQKNKINHNFYYNLLKQLEKDNKKSIKYRILKNKKALKISGYSYKYKKIILDFQNKKYFLEVDKNNKFKLELKKINSWIYYINFYWIDDSKQEVFLKKSRKVNLLDSYIKNIWEIKTKIKKKEEYIKNKDIINKNINIFEENKIFYNFRIFILKLLIWILTILFVFLIFLKKNILQKI